MSNYQLDKPVVSSPPERAVLSLSNIRTTQQELVQYEALRRSREKNKGSFFRFFDTPPRYCQAQRIPVLQIDKDGRGTFAQAIPVYCNQWGCPVCGPRKAKKLQKELIQIIVINSLDHFVTVTLKPSTIPEEYRNKTGIYITKLFNHLRLILERKLKRKILYVWIKEFQGNGNAHLHILIKGYIPQKILRREWERIGGGRRIDIQQIKNVEATAVYLTAYLVKQVKEKTPGFLYGERRYSYSQRCIRPEKHFPESIKVERFSDFAQRLTISQFFDFHDMVYNPDCPYKVKVFNSFQLPLKL